MWVLGLNETMDQLAMANTFCWHIHLTYWDATRFRHWCVSLSLSIVRQTDGMLILSDLIVETSILYVTRFVGLSIVIASYVMHLKC